MTKETALSRSQRKQLQQQRNDVMAVLSHGPSRRLLRRVFDITGIYATTHATGEEAAKQAGRRNVGLDLMAMLNDADPYAYASILAEAVKDAEDRKAEIKRTPTDVDE